MAVFEQKMLPALIDIADDKVPNVRLVVGKCLYKCAQSGELEENCYGQKGDDFNCFSFYLQHTLWRVWNDD